MFNSGNNLSSGNSTSPLNMPPLPQCLSLDPIPLGNPKYMRPGEIRRVLGVPLGNASEDHSFGAPHSKSSSPVATGELKHFKESVQDSSKKARDRAKMLRDSISKLDKYREGLSSKKRQRSDLSSERTGGMPLTKIGTHMHRNPNDNGSQTLEDKTKSIVLNKRIRTSAADSRMDGRSVATLRQPMVSEKVGDMDHIVSGSPARVEEKTRRLLAGGEGLDQKIKKKRSVGAVGNRIISSDCSTKRATHLKMSSNSKLRLCDTQGFRLKSSLGVSGMNKSEVSLESAGPGTRMTYGNDQEGAPLTRDHTVVLGQRVTAKGNNRVNTQEEHPSSPNTIIKGKISRAPRTGSIMGLESSSSGPFPGTSIHPMTQWVGQRPHKNSRSRRANVIPPVSSNAEAQVSSQDLPNSDFSSRASPLGANGSQPTCGVENDSQKIRRESDNVPSPFAPSESEESGAGENKFREKGTDSSEFALATQKAGTSMLSMRKNKILTDASGDGVRRQGRTGRSSSLIRPGTPSVREKSENLPTMKPLLSMNPEDKSRSKTGRPPSKKQKDRKVSIRIGKTLNSGTSDFTGESDDDHEELHLAAKNARNASNLACSGPFWKKLELIFAPVSLDDTSYIKQQLNFGQELDESLSQILGVDCNILGVVINKDVTQSSVEVQVGHLNQEPTKSDAFSGKYCMERSGKVTPLYQRVLSALIEEDEIEESCRPIEGKSMSLQCASDDSHCGSCNQIDFGLKDRDKMESEVESTVDLQYQKNFLLDGLSCDRSAVSNTIRNQNMSSSSQSTGVWQGDDEFSHSDGTHTSEICSNDEHHVELNAPGISSTNSQYQLMCLDDRLLLELHSIGLFPEILPDLAEGEEAINQDIMELKEGLYQQIESKKKNLGKVDKAIHKGRDAERQQMEQVAYDQLIEMAYRKRLASRGSSSSKGAIRKVSKQAALAFLERTLARCKKFEETGDSCFNEPALQSVIFSPSPNADAKSTNCIGSGTASNTCNETSNQAEVRTYGAVSSVLEGLDSHGDNLDGGMAESRQHIGSTITKEKRREMLIDDVVGSSSSRASTFDRTVFGGTKGKRSERERDHGANENERKTKLKPKQKSNHVGPQRKFMEAMEPASQTVLGSSEVMSHNPKNGRDIDEAAAVTTTGNRHKVNDPVELGNLPLNELDSMEDFGVSNELGGNQDLSSWLNFDEDGLLEHDSIGLEIPMDDISDLMLM